MTIIASVMHTGYNLTLKLRYEKTNASRMVIATSSSDITVLHSLWSLGNVCHVWQACSRELLVQVLSMVKFAYMPSSNESPLHLHRTKTYTT